MKTYEPDPDQLQKLLSMTTEQFSCSRLAVKIYSDLLETEIFLISDPTLASKVEGVAYTTNEVDVLAKIRYDLKPHYRERLRKIHQTKKTFHGILLAPGQV
ncbi:MAG: hypothetical protein GXP58_00940 [Deltaproteobacteria bacterium]|nr:hypothetical protein [Deltaproteobacteria bacterium]